MFEATAPTLEPIGTTGIVLRSGVAIADTRGPTPHSTAIAAGVFRPVQYLGAKARVLEALLKAAALELDANAPVVDIFSGSSLVAQGLARRGHPVAAYDALEHCTHFARALLGAGRLDGETAPEPDTLPQVRSDWVAAWQPWVDTEDLALADSDPDSLIALTREIPQVWRPSAAVGSLAQVLSRMTPGGSDAAGLIAAHYAGTYFGIRQAVELDELRSRIAAARSQGALSAWQESVLITALLSAASECVFSAGKHYAQPHRIRPGKDLSFIRKRILSDRCKSIGTLFHERVALVVNSVVPAGDHHVETSTLERLARSPNLLKRPAAVYADPPYTAQQYSRFYHVPEIISRYRVPTLATVNRRVTRGLYPTERHKSRFCSRRLAPAAFADLCRLVVAQDATLLLSYSYSRNGETGNRRAIDLPDLRSLLRSFFTDVRECEIALTYRQFNSRAAAVAARSDVELLIVATNHA